MTNIRTKEFGHAVMKKAAQAADLIASSIGEKGFFAGSGERYQGQYWTRDAGLAIIPAIHPIHALGLDRAPSKMDYLGLINAAREHLLQLSMRQGKNGAIPILFSDFEQLLEKKMQKNGIKDLASERHSIRNSFVLRRIADGMYGDEKEFPEFADFENPAYHRERGLYRLTPGTTDSELMFALAVTTAAPFSRKAAGLLFQISALRALDYLECHHVRDGLMVGADWRDTMEKFFANKPLLSNNAIRCAVHGYYGTGKEKEIAQRIDDVFWDGKQYMDYPGSTRFDPLGASIAVLTGLVPKERYPSVMDGLESVDTDWGVTIQCRHNPYMPAEAEVIERTDGVVVWPFVCGFAALAAHNMGQRDFALQQLEKMTRQKGFGEWYDPLDGAQYGEPLQGWSAALYLRVCEEMLKRGCIRLS